MMISKILGAAVVTASLFAAGNAIADNQPQRPGATPGLQAGQLNTGVLAQIAHIQCQMGSGDVLARVLIRNVGPSAIAPGTQIAWHTNGGINGVGNTGLAGLAPGAALHIGNAPYPFTCTASIQN